MSPPTPESTADGPTRHYTRADYAWHDHAGQHWVAGLPHGPIMMMEGIGALVLQVIETVDEPITATQVTALLREYVEDMPADAQATIEVFLADLVECGILSVGAAASN